MIIPFIFFIIFLVSGTLALFSLKDLKPPENSGIKIKRKEKKGLFGVINLVR